METVTEFIFLGSKITADSDCSQEIKRLAAWKESYDKPEWVSESCSVVSDSLQFHGQNTAVGSLALLQGIFPTQESNLSLPHCRQILYQLSHKGSPDKSRQHIKKQRHHFVGKGLYGQTMIFPIVMYGCDSWTKKLSIEELMALNCGAGEDSWESLG